MTFVPHFSKLEMMTAAKRTVGRQFFETRGLPFVAQATMDGEHFNRSLGAFIGLNVTPLSYSWQKYGMNIAGAFFMTFGRDPKYRILRAHW